VSDWPYSTTIMPPTLKTVLEGARGVFAAAVTMIRSKGPGSGQTKAAIEPISR